MDQDTLKRQAAEAGVGFIQSGMVVGLGHGSTALAAVRILADRLARGELRDIVAIPCSPEIEAESRRLGIPLTTLEEHPRIDVTVDGADEVDPQLNLIKGGGGALLREKIVAQASRREVIMVDESKLSPRLGARWAVPVEVLEYGLRSQREFIESIGGHPVLRLREGAPFRTANGHLILDCNFGPIADPAALATQLKQRTGIIEHGLFVGMASEVVVAGTTGVRILKRQGSR
ncbi:MAG TPA: ribose-5-phosphate isomerase RpiA [bacterium]|nr:ribose-5-phosphate isomerase RpiA [bacterium]